MQLAWMLSCAVTGPARNGTSDTSHTDPPPTEPFVESLCQVDLACGGNILDEPKAPCSLTIRDGDGLVEYEGRAGVEKRGRSSLAFPKPQYAVELREVTEVPLWPGWLWRYDDSGDAPDPAWRDPTYDDAEWDAGAAPLGAGQPYLVTEVDPGATTVYLRARFELYTPLDQIDSLTLGLVRDDGAAIYLNGVEVLRDNLPEGADSTTPATTPLTPTQSARFLQVEVEPGALVPGTNVIAVELHQGDAVPGDLRFDLYAEVAGDDAPTNLLGMGKEDDWILNGQYVDRALYRNRFAYDVFQSLGDLRYATDTRFCEMTLDGQYVGVYTLGERLDRDDDRIDIGSDDSFIVKLDDEEGTIPTAVGYGAWEIEYPDPDEAEGVADYLQSFEAAVLDGGPMFDWVDLGSAVDWVLLQELMGNHDAYLLSVHLWKDEDGPMFFAPWDMDLSMGYPLPDCDAEGWNPRQFTTYYGDLVDAQFVQAFAADPTFHEALVARWRELRGAQWSDEVLFRRVDSFAATLAPAIAANSDRWPIAEVTFPVQYIETLCPVSSWEEEHARTKTWLAQRLAWIDANIETF